VRSRPVIVHPALPWSWRRRIVLLAELEVGGRRLAVVDVHLSPHDLGTARLREVAVTLAAARVARLIDDLVVVGDCNDLPGTTGPAGFVAAGWRDAWSVTHPAAAPREGVTNWTPGDRTGRPPTQRLDYVFLPPSWRCVEMRMAEPDPDRGWDDWARLSDHLPVAARLSPA
jgi:endonuclease/exonuclease/phosphatase family metal-dependent hydrolase